MAEKKTTVRDLQTFIDAVEFASDAEEWVPSARQWKRIRDMINSLESEPAQPVMQREMHQFPPQVFAQQPQGQFIPAVPAGPSALTPNVMPSPHMQQNTLFGQGPNPAKTPDIDTTHGQYSSSFA